MIELLKRQKLLTSQLQVLRDQLMLAESQVTPIKEQIDIKMAELIQVTEQMRVPPPTYGQRNIVGQSKGTVKEGKTH